MQRKAIRARQWLAGNWFVPLLALLLLVEFAFSRSVSWSDPAFAEAAMLFDLAVFVPALFLLCYGGRLAARTLLLRAGALSLLGIYIASHLVPAQAQVLLPNLSWARVAGQAVLMLIELRLVYEVLKMVFTGRSSAGEVAARTGAPQWVVRLMLLEARFWKAVWRILSGRG